MPPCHSVRIFFANAPVISDGDWKAPCDQVRTLHADDCTNAVRLDLQMVDGLAAQLTLGPCVVNYFVDYLDGGIKAGQELGPVRRTGIVRSVTD